MLSWVHRCCLQAQKGLRRAPALGSVSYGWLREREESIMGIAACLEDAQEHGSSGITQLLNALVFDEGEGTLLKLSLDLGKSHQG